jgi:hypothetical protein
LCSFEHASVGRNQIAPAVGGFLEFFKDQDPIANLVEPICTLDIDLLRDNIGGELSIVDSREIANLIVAKYRDFKDSQDKSRESRNLSFRNYVIEKYDWKKLGKKFTGIVHSICGPELKLTDPLPPIEEDLEEELEDCVSIDTIIPIPSSEPEEFVSKKEFDELSQKIKELQKLLNYQTAGYTMD